MHSEVLLVDAERPDLALLARAAEVLRRGGLVAFPTETVYGLGGNALDPQAVHKIFKAKGRPSKNPLIVHVPDVQATERLVQEWPKTAESLASHFWPGPLTLVVRKSAAVPDLVTAGGTTVALRVPAHPVAQGLLRACGLPLAAPSANRSSRLSPTRIEHVLHDLDGLIDMVLDAGPTPGGLESTVLDVTVQPPRLLRPGLITPAAMEKVIGPVEQAASLLPGPGKPRQGKLAACPTDPLRSPGLLGRHYAPQTPLEISENACQRVEELARAGNKVGWLTFTGQGQGETTGVTVVDLPTCPEGYAAGLYAALHELDRAGLDRIVVTSPPLTEAWLAIRDRLQRGSIQE